MEDSLSPTGGGPMPPMPPSPPSSDLAATLGDSTPWQFPPSAKAASATSNERSSPRALAATLADNAAWQEAEKLRIESPGKDTAVSQDPEKGPVEFPARAQPAAASDE